MALFKVDRAWLGTGSFNAESFEMRKITLTCLLALTSLLPSIASATPARDGSHDFDFTAGTWTTQLTIVKDPFNTPTDEVHKRGRKTARPIWGGKGWIEEIEADGWQAANVFLYDPEAGQWSENYVDSSEGKMDPPSVGDWRDGKLEFYSIQAVGGRSMLCRGTWTITSKDYHEYEVDRSLDGGRSWHRSFLAKVTRAK